MHLADTFIQSDLQYSYTFLVSICVPWELNPQTFVLLMQCSTTEPQEHIFMIIRKSQVCEFDQSWSKTLQENLSHTPYLRCNRHGPLKKNKGSFVGSFLPYH